MARDTVIVMKFGGTSVFDASRISHVASIAADELRRARAEDPAASIAVVLSAMKGTTDSLLDAAVSAAQTYEKPHEQPYERPHEYPHEKPAEKYPAKYPAKSPAKLSQKSAAKFTAKSTATEEKRPYRKEYEKIVARHTAAWSELSGGAPLPADIDHAFRDLEELLHGIAFVKECTARTKDLIASFGERLSCMLMAHYLQQYFDVARAAGGRARVQYVDTRSCIITDEAHGEAAVKFAASYAAIKKALRGFDISVITGFIGSTEDGVTTTLGRNGSDYTAALVGAAVGASRVEIWTDVDGVLSADPRIVPDAFVIPRISYSEAMELSYFGAKVIHPQTVVPALEKNIPIVIKNTLNPSAPGTVIEQERCDEGNEITGIASTRHAAMLTVEGAGLSGNFYFLPRIFTVFAKNHVQPLMISQSSSEHSICFVLQDRDTQRMAHFLQHEFREELQQKRIQRISVMPDISVISIVGVRMRGTRGLSGRVFRSVGGAGINVIAIAQGSNEINISFVVVREDEEKALRTLHAEFFKKIPSDAKKPRAARAGASA